MIDFMCGPPFFKRLGKSHKRKHNECSLKDITVGHGDARPAMSSSALRMSVKGLGRVKTLGGRRSELAEVSDARRFRGFGYARIAAKSGRMPMMFMTRVRL